MTKRKNRISVARYIGEVQGLAVEVGPPDQLRSLTYRVITCRRGLRATYTEPKPFRLILAGQEAIQSVLTMRDLEAFGCLAGRAVEATGLGLIDGVVTGQDHCEDGAALFMTVRLPEPVSSAVARGSLAAMERGVRLPPHEPHVVLGVVGNGQPHVARRRDGLYGNQRLPSVIYGRLLVHKMVSGEAGKPYLTWRELVVK